MEARDFTIKLPRHIGVDDGSRTHKKPSRWQRDALPIELHPQNICLEKGYLVIWRLIFIYIPLLFPSHTMLMFRLLIWKPLTAIRAVIYGVYPEIRTQTILGLGQFSLPIGVDRHTIIASI